METSDTPATLADLPNLTPGDQAAILSRYEILEMVGRGGMGVVYRARHRKLNRLVAVKICLPSMRAERFNREAQLLASLHSPHVVAVHDFDELANGQALLVMDWVAGSDLGTLLSKHQGPLPEARALVCMRQVAEGMASAADQGIVHRDLKPSNILIDAKDQAFVADFGLARSSDADQLSLTAGLLGTPYYMAPEQAEDPRGVDTRADIYSFGATFYHVLTGKPPFEGGTAFTILYKHKTEPLVAPRFRNETLSDHTSELLERCLAKAPADRFASFGEILQQLLSSKNAVSPWLFSDDPELTLYLENYQARRKLYLDVSQPWERPVGEYYFPGGKTLTILLGNLVDQQVDALVSSDTWFLTMLHGVSLALSRAAGPTVVQECHRLAPVRAGRAAVTSAGNLPARMILHGVTIGYSNSQFVSPSRDLIYEIMNSCFYHADSHSIRSIAFPLLGTGALAFPRDICLDTMFQFLARMLLRGLTSVTDARIVIFDDRHER